MMNMLEERQSVTPDLRAISDSSTLEEAQEALEQFAHAGNGQYPTSSASWRRDWARLTVVFDYPPEVRQVLDTTNACESLKFSVRKVLNKRWAFPMDKRSRKCSMSGCTALPRNGRGPLKLARNQFAIQLRDRATTSDARKSLVQKT